MLEPIGFLDEPWLKTNMAKTTGWAPRGRRLVDHTPFGHWRTQTFVATLRHDRLDAPWVIDGTMNRVTFDTYVETQLAPTLNKGDVIILPSHRFAAQNDCRAMDNLSSHKSAHAAETLRDIGAWFHCSGETPHWGLSLPLQSAALLTRSQPHRDGFLKTQGADHKGSSKNIR